MVAGDENQIGIEYLQSGSEVDCVVGPQRL